MKYIAYLSSGEILETAVFKTIYRAALSRLRDDGTGAAIIRRKADNKLITVLWRGFHMDFIFTDKNKIENIKPLLLTTYLADKWGQYCWDMAGLDN